MCSFCKQTSTSSSPSNQQRRKTFPPWRKCCCGACGLGAGTRLVACFQILIAVAFLVITLLNYAGQHELNYLTDAFLIAVITHGCLALLCSALVFLALHFRRPWLLGFELVFLASAILQHLAASIVFEYYVLRDGLVWLSGRTRNNPTDKVGFLCQLLPQEQWPVVDWCNVLLAGVYLSAAVLTIWFFGVVWKCYFYLKRKCSDEKKRREKAAETLGLLGNGGGGGLVAACGAGGVSASTHSRSTLTTSLTATTYEHSSRDPDLLLRY